MGACLFVFGADTWGDYPLSASISSERAMANAMVPTVDDGERMVGLRMAMRVKA